jgi:hypothetical protein
MTHSTNHLFFVSQLKQKVIVILKRSIWLETVHTGAMYVTCGCSRGVEVQVQHALHPSFCTFFQ